MSPRNERVEPYPNVAFAPRDSTSVRDLADFGV
jgi:hypothetical protein